MAQKRYAVTFSMYVYADDDQQAIDKAKKFASKIDMKLDNQASVDDIMEVPFGSIAPGRAIKFPK